MGKSTFNGWTNWETHSVACWFDRDAGLSQAKKDFMLHCRPRLSGKAVKGFVAQVLPDGTPDFQGHGGAECYRQVYWPEVAEMWRADRRLALRKRRRRR